MMNGAVSGVVHWALSEAVRMAMYWAAAEHRPVYVAWYTAVNLAVDVPMNRALVQPEEPPHLGLGVYLGGVGG